MFTLLVSFSAFLIQWKNQDACVIYRMFNDKLFASNKMQKVIFFATILCIKYRVQRPQDLHLSFACMSAMYVCNDIFIYPENMDIQSYTNK